MSQRYAIATPSYAGDVERCRLLCASIDRFVTGHTVHYLLVEDQDAALFAPFAGPRRRVIVESDLLPRWLKARPDPLSLGRRRIWTSFGALRRGVPPLRGWHTQQLRKFALPTVTDEDVILFCDSDMCFLRPFDMASLETADGTRLFVKPDGVTADMSDHVAWVENASRLLGVSVPALPSRDYINNPVSWRRDTALAMLDHIEATSGRDWVSAIAAQRRFSEYIIYGTFCERVLGVAASGHRIDSHELCKVYWTGDAAEIATLRSFEEVLDDGQVAVAIQSFIGQPIERIRKLFEAQ